MYLEVKHICIESNVQVTAAESLTQQIAWFKSCVTLRKPETEIMLEFDRLLVCDRKVQPVLVFLSTSNILMSDNSIVLAWIQFQRKLIGNPGSDTWLILQRK